MQWSLMMVNIIRAGWNKVFLFVNSRNNIYVIKINAMKKIWILFLFSILCFNVFATHNRAGEITYTHISGLQYKIRVTTYTGVNPLTTQTDRCELIIYFGDGDSAAAPRINGLSNECTAAADGEFIGNNIKKNIYETIHTYRNYTKYTITMEDPNRNGGICNIPNSIDQSFYIDAELFAYTPTFINSSPQFISVPIFYALVGTNFVESAAAADPDGDMLRYELAACKGTGGLATAGYTYPSGFTIDSLTGQINWNMPNMICTYNFAVKVKKWRNGIQIGYVIRDFQIDCVSSFTGISDLSNNRQKISLYPIPASDKIFISGLNAEFGNTLFIYDLTGRLVKNVFLSGSTPEIEIADITKGFYNYEIVSNKNSIARGKFVKN